MKYYTLEPNTSAKQWNAGMTESEDKRIDFFKRYNMSFNQLWDIDTSIELILWYQDFEDSGLTNYGFADIHLWQGNTMSKPKVLGAPMAIHKLLSKELAATIGKFKVANHKFHDCQITKVDVQQVKQYSILQLTNDFYQHLDYPSIKFKVLAEGEVLNEYNEGQIGSLDAFFDVVESYDNVDKHVEVTSDVFAFNKRLDVFTNHEGEILFSESVIKALIDRNPKGLEIRGFNKYEIIMPK